MSKNEEQYLQELFERFKSNWDFRKEIAAFGKYLVSPNWMILPYIATGEANGKKRELLGYIKLQVDERHKLSDSDTEKVLLVIKKSEKTKVFEEFTLHSGVKGFCYPLLIDAKLFGFIVLSCTKRSYFEPILDVFQSYTEVVIKFVQREMELEELNETIRPRAIALSTVHTVYRLLNSTLILSELLEELS